MPLFYVFKSFIKGFCIDEYIPIKKQKKYIITPKNKTCSLKNKFIVLQR